MDRNRSTMEHTDIQESGIYVNNLDFTFKITINCAAKKYIHPHNKQKT